MPERLPAAALVAKRLRDVACHGFDDAIVCCSDIVAAVDMGTRIYCAGGWYTGDTLDITAATRAGVTIQFGGGPMPQDWYGTLEAIADGRLDPVPSIGQVITLEEVPEAMELARRSAGPPRIVVHPNGAPA